MDQWWRMILRTIFRLVLLLAGLVFVASLLAAALLVLAVWLLRAAWARLTGKPVSPWTFRVDRQAMWNRFYRPGAGGAASGRDDRDVVDVVDVVAKETTELSEVRGIEPPRR